MKQEPLLSTKHLVKRFAGVTASDDVSLDIGACEIHAIIGENGAGKSTFCKMLTGQYIPDEGEIWFQGRKMHFSNTSDSMAAGIGMVYQERNLVGYLTGAQNITLGHEPRKHGLIDEKACLQAAEDLRKKLNITTPVNVPVETLGAGAQQLIEIMQAFYSNPKLLILDEPTASLGEGEIEPFLSFVRNLTKQMNISVIFITHKLDEVFAIADRISVFTEGKCMMTVNKEDTTQEECIKMMLRSDKVKPIVVKDQDFSNRKTIFEIEKISFGGKERSVPFSVKEGQVVGLYGLVGAGRTETMECVCGIRPADRLEYTFMGEKITSTTAQQAIRRGIAITPEIRRNGTFPALSLSDNICNLFLDRLSRRFQFVDFGESRKLTGKVLEGNNVKYSSPSQAISELSGGNMQKLIIGRSIEIDGLKMLVIDEPTAGMDLGAKSEICLKIRNLADEGDKCVVYISSELDELMAACDKIYIFRDGNVVGSFDRHEFDKTGILDAALRGDQI